MMLNMMYFYKFCGIFLLNWHLLVNFVWHLLANFTWHILLISRGIHFGICLLISHDIISHSITFCVEFILWHSLTSNFVWHLFTNFAWHSLANFAWHSLANFAWHSLANFAWHSLANFAWHSLVN